MKYIVKAPAKINLSLDVLHKRDDGYHEVEMVMTTVDLADRIEITEVSKDAVFVDVSKGIVPSDHQNLAYQAAMLLKKRFGVRKGVHLYIHKHIPVSAGLAGGSTNAAATLRGLNKLWGLGLSIDELAELGSEIGSDVPFCVYGGTALATGRGEKIEKLSTPPPCWVVLAKPPIGVSTKEIYGNLNLNDIAHPNTEAVIEAINQGDFERICSSLGNAMEATTFSLYPKVDNLKKQMENFGADGVLMSGSGPTVFALAKNESRAWRIYNGLKGFVDQVYAVRLLSE
ncbi:4-(cytidine 5'-diphospho)-2-C-methyl-D-erythritol kinase [Texcoconibacillus texcoconensis]|uniref:4-diphosphocytidyl-2-C-methyl-D-erythritol kinase n=1 Tax=Texcoconibacillus texcoconensis TaxID=1095777 RepID=A0A840QUF5_9BACI|nr:4-(cytidine 5'-diphospho)-2-C-methyl-D-erythritol kinase [Texcoconibacillus texcoconensis]MBB5174911.1 4-diphosphocytidyl-2-C-methyl-D-erythritol kinase [Texcoconibacillus texcoconensis]